MANARQIAVLLHGCDDEFDPPLSARVDIDAYAQKIFKSAQCYEAWADDVLIGLVAVYSDTVRGAAFITNVCVLPAWRSKGLASHLLESCTTSLCRQNILFVELEVGAGNKAARGLYAKHGFSVFERQMDKVSMRLELRGQKNDREA